MNRSYLPIALFALASLWRVAATFDLTLVNYAPVTAVAFCGAAFFRDRLVWLAAAAAVVLPDLWINHHYATVHGYTWTPGEMLLRVAALAVAGGLGWWAARRRTFATVLAGAVASSLLFYLITNTASWAADPFYMRTTAGWWQAVTVGHPEFPPSLLFLRNALAGDLAFTGLCALWSLAAVRRPTSLTAHATD